MSAAATSSDLLAYPNYPLPQTHPDRLGAIGTLLGLSPAPVERCRVLELGCGDGSNLIPMGLSYPQSSFLGIDLSEAAIAAGSEIVAGLEMVNVALQAGNLVDFPADAGPFDYIIAHGLYSWVAPAVRDQLMNLCRDHLATNGIAYISYNTLPGCHVRRLLRDMMRFHVRHEEDPVKRVDQALALVKMIGEAKARDKDPYSLLIRQEMTRASSEQDRAVLYHDDLADINDPVFFHEFAADAAAHGLQFLAEADFFEMTGRLFPPDAAAMLKGMDDPILREQYLDFLKCRRFRQTLLVRQEAKVLRQPAPERIEMLSISSRVKPVSSRPSLAKGAKESFREASGGSTMLDLPLAKSAFLQLGESYPLPIKFADLVTVALARPGMPAEPGDAHDLAEILYAAYEVGIVDLHSGPVTFVRHAGEKPLASPLVRWQLRHGKELVTTLRHSSIRVENATTRQMILLLDGTRDRTRLLEDLLGWASTHPDPGLAPTPEPELRERLSNLLEPSLAQIAAMGLLIG